MSLEDFYNKTATRVRHTYTDGWYGAAGDYDDDETYTFPCCLYPLSSAEMLSLGKEATGTQWRLFCNNGTLLKEDDEIEIDTDTYDVLAVLTSDPTNDHLEVILGLRIEEEE